MKRKNFNDQGLLDPRFLEKSYQEAMALAQAVARYLEVENKHFKGGNIGVDTEVYYASESMRVSTCLMQVLSWFLVQKGVASGEISKEKAAVEHFRLGATDICLEKVDTDKGNLPIQFIGYMQLVQNLYRQVARMDEMVYGDNEMANPVHEMLSQIQNKETPEDL